MNPSMVIPLLANQDLTPMLYPYIHILLFVHGSPPGKKPDLQGAMLKKKKAT